MIVEDNRKTGDFLPRKDIPDAWAKGRCPTCGTAPLKVIHLPDSPDYLLCAHCEMSFEVETNGGAIRLKNIPEQLGFVEEELHYRWVQPATLRKFLDNRAAIMQQKEKASQKSLLDDDVWNRTLSLYRLGNTPKMIQFTLMQAGATREQAEAASARLKQWIEQDSKRQGRKFLVVGGVAFSVILVMIAGLALTIGSINSQLSEVANPVTTKEPILPLQVLNLLPQAVKPGFLKSEPARVEAIGPAKSRCPTFATDAARLFGGEQGAWRTGGQVADSWQMMNAGAPATIRIPQGMYAGYIDNKTFMLISVNGPATIYNVNFVAIMCN
jgi:hypothetical protein